MAPPQYIDNLSMETLLQSKQDNTASPPPQTQTTNANKKPLVLFLDFDGTLAPIVPIPSDAAMPHTTRSLLQKLTSQYDIFIVSGREREDVKKRVNVEHLGYAGSHGFEIEINGEVYEALKNDSMRQDLDTIFQELQNQLSHVNGCILEHNNWSLSVHYRCCESDADVEKVMNTVNQIYQNSDNASSYQKSLKISHGKKVIEIKPNIDWHKGKAVEHIMECYSKERNLKNNQFLPLYIGDDRTDEDAFEQVQSVGGIGIIVAESTDPRIVEGTTKAKYYVNNPEEVVRFLCSLTASGVAE